MKQKTLAMAADQGGGYEQYRRATKRDVFLATMNEIVPWQALCKVIEPHYPKAGPGRQPVGLQRILRMYFVQHWFNRPIAPPTPWLARWLAVSCRPWRRPGLRHRSSLSAWRATSTCCSTARCSCRRRQPT